jgi:UDP-N-acetylmuramoyl-tripeptide--D-alanyl-D-alanine ligase
VREGDLFFALAGETRDGHDFVGQALAAGAWGAVVNREIDLPHDSTIVQVPDTLQALQQLSVAVRRKSDATVVAVTGSAGKTTTKEMIAHILGSQYNVLKSEASYNNHLGVPLTLLAIEPSHSHVVSEIGTNGIGEIDSLARLVGPHIGVITNVGLAHIGNFGTQDKIAAEKLSLFRHVTPQGTCIINGDDERLSSLACSESAGKRLIRVGFERQNVLRADQVNYGETGTSGIIICKGEVNHFSIRATGKHFVYAALLSIAVALETGIDMKKAIDSMETFDPSPGRSSISRLRPGLLVVDDSYNASPDAMFAALELLAVLPSPVKIAVLGEMRELGEKSVNLHQLVGEKVALVATHLITVGLGGHAVKAAACTRGLDVNRIWSAESARHALEITSSIVESAANGDCAILVKGSRLTHMERVPLGLSGVSVRCGLDICSLYINCRKCPKLEGC